MIHVFPAVPDAWREISFCDIGVPGAARVSAERQQGRTASIALRSLRGGTFTIDAEDLREAVLWRGSTRQPVTLPLTLDLQPNEQIKLEREAL